MRASSVRASALLFATRRNERGMNRAESGAKDLTVSLVTRTTPLTRSDGLVTSRQPHVMVVEDDAAMRQLLMRVLGRERYRVTALADGADLLKTVLASPVDERPSLIISDVRMPGISGLDVLAALRAAELHMPVVLISAFCDEQTLGRAAKLGATCVLSKPFDMDMLRGLALCLLASEGATPSNGSTTPGG
jgi:CheY-like chemotaxis protein